MHKFKLFQEFEDGFSEICERCGKVVHYRNTDPNEKYMMYNVRRLLHPSRDEAFYEEYPNAR